MKMDDEVLEQLVNRMRLAALYAHNHRVLIGTIKSQEHLDILERAISNVLSTELAIFTCAQLLDGLPIADVAFDRRFTGIEGEHIIEDVHENLCPGALEKARELYRDWDPSTLKFNPKVLCIPWTCGMPR